MLVFPDDLNKKMTSFREKTAFYIFNYLCKGFPTKVSKNNLGGLHKIEVTPIQDNIWS